MIRIIDNKKVLLTDDEHKMYKNICRSYDRDDGFRGEELFRELFAADEKGFIIFIKPPPSNAPIPMEVYMFMISIMIHQHIGGACDEVQKFLHEGRQVINEMRALLAESKK